MDDYLGIRIEEEIEEEIKNGGYASIKPLITKGWEKTKNASFAAWGLLYDLKEDAAIEYRKKHVMARDAPLGLYICHKNNLDRAFSYTIKSCITELEKESLLGKTLLLSCEIPDLKLAKKTIALSPNIIDEKAPYIAQKTLEAATRGGNIELVKHLCKSGVRPNLNDDMALKLSIESENQELIKYFVKTANFANIDYYYLNEKMAQPARTKSFVTLLNCGTFLEGNNHQLLRSIDASVRSLRPKTHRKELNQILAAYPKKGLEDIVNYKNKELANLGKYELKRRRSVELSKSIQAVFKKDLILEF